MRLLTIVLLALLASLGSHRATAQCLPLATFLSLGVETGGDTPPAVAAQALASTEWKYLGPMGNTKELTWASVAAEGSTPTFQVSLRPVLQRYDVVVKTSVSNCFRQLRGELNDRKIKPEPITCPNCEGQRYNLPEGGSVSLYSNMKGAYPMVIVMHLAEAPPGSKAAVTRTP